MRKVSGFTIIELIVVITILGILTAVALPKFFSITTDAQKAAAAGFAGAIASGAAVNYSAFLAQGSVTTGSATAVNTCTAATLNLVLTTAMPSPGYTVTGGGVTPANGTTFTCTISATDGGGSLVAGTGSSVSIIAVN